MSILNKIELQAGGFNEAANDWAALFGIKQSFAEITGASASIMNDPSVAYLMNSSSAQTLTVPAGLTLLPTTSVVTVIVLGTGTVTIAAGAGTTILKSSPTLIISGQYEIIHLIKLPATNTWLAKGAFN